MNVSDFLADRQIRANRREADEPNHQLAERVMTWLAITLLLAAVIVAVVAATAPEVGISQWRNL